MTPETTKRRARFWRWLRQFNERHPEMDLTGLLAFALDAGVCSREERDALLRAVGLR